MTVNEIKAAVDAGKHVFWSNINYIPSLASRRAWDNPKLAEWSELELELSISTSTSKRGRILCATINSILVLMNLYLIMENMQ